MTPTYKPLAASLLLLLNTPLAYSAAPDIERIEVKSDFRSASLAEVPASVSVIDSIKLEDEGARHFEDIINGIANLNWAGGSSRPRYFQIRGVGERSEYKGAPNASVGFLYDDIDLSGLGMTASLFDIEQVEVLRGPQGTRYGANALAGLMYVKSKDPTDSFEHGAQLDLGQDDLRTLSAYSSGPVSDAVQYRVALQKHQQNGFRDNSYLNRDDTNQRDELTGRAKLRWLAGDNATIDLTLLHADFNNGYDAWALDNSRSVMTDKPGEDSQKSNAASLRATVREFSDFDFVSLTSYANSDHRHAYDGDWANPDYWASKDCGGEPCEYDYWWDKQGKRTTWSQEFRLSSTDQGRIFNGTTDWLLGVYGLKLDESNDLDSAYNGYPDEVLISDFESTNLAIFTQLDSDLGQGLSLSVGGRIENRETDYSDSANDHFSPSETMWGGHIALTKAFSATQHGYIKLARGYKAGGFNMSLPVELASKKEFETETLYNYELGWKSVFFNHKLHSNLALFYMDREDQQVNASIQNPEKPQRFILFTDNATSSTNYGVEWELNWLASEALTLYSSLGLLKAEFDQYQYKDKYGSVIDMSGRELAHAPHTTYSLGGTYLFAEGWFANVNANGKSAFYYSNSHDSRSSAYTLLNAKIGYQADHWSVALWGRNLTDKDYGVRGFYFGNEPDLDWAAKEYIRYGDPRQIGLTLAVDL